MFFRMVHCEWKKLRTSSIWLPVFAAPFLAIVVGSLMSRMALSPGEEVSWSFIYTEVVRIYATMFLPILAGILASLICRTEHLTGGWKQLLALPISRTTVFAAKFFYVLLFLALIQVFVFGGVLLDGLVFLQLHARIPWTMLCKGFIGGWIATIPLAALQLWVATWWKSFASPFALNVIFTIPALAIGGSSLYAPLYPFAEPMLAMLPKPNGLLYFTPEMTATVAITGVIFIAGGWLHFNRRDVHA